MENGELGIRGTRLDDGSYTRAENGTWAWALVKVGGIKTRYSPYPYLVSKLKEHGLRSEQDRQQFIAHCVTDMRLHPWTDEGRDGCPGFAYAAQPFRYKYWLQHMDGSPEEAWRGVVGKHLLPPLQKLVQEWRAIRRANAAAAAAAEAPQAEPAGAEAEQGDEHGTGDNVDTSDPAEPDTPAPADSGPAAAAKQRTADRAVYGDYEAAAVAGNDNTGHSAAAAAAAATPSKRAGDAPAAGAAPAVKKTTAGRAAAAEEVRSGGAAMAGDARQRAAAAAAGAAGAAAGAGSSAAAAAAGSAGNGEDNTLQALLRDMMTKNPDWGKNPDLVAIVRNVTERPTEASRAAAAQARAVEEAVRTEAAKAHAIAQIVANGVGAVQQLQAGAAVLAGAGRLGGGNMQQLQALPGGRMNAEEVGEEVGGEN